MSMLLRKLQDCAEFVAGDATFLREILHPDKLDARIRYSLAHGYIRPGESSVPHLLKTSEVYYIIDGQGVMHIDEEAASVGPGDTIYVPPGGKQHLENTGSANLVFLCIVDPAWRIEDEEVL